eukprot:Rmarinus@m.4447
MSEKIYNTEEVEAFGSTVEDLLDRRNTLISKIRTGGQGSQSLGPPDLCILRKRFDNIVVDNPQEYVFFHHVVGLDVSTAAAVSAYIHDIMEKQEEASWLASGEYKVVGGCYCSFDAFSQQDLRVTFSIPGQTSVVAVDKSLVPRETDGVCYWVQAGICSILRGLQCNSGMGEGSGLLRYTTADMMLFPALKIIEPLPDTVHEELFLRAVLDNVKSGGVLGSSTDTSEVCVDAGSSRMLATIADYFEMRRRYHQSVTFFRVIMDTCPSAAVYIAHVYKQVGKDKQALSILDEAIALIRNSPLAKPGKDARDGADDTSSVGSDDKISELDLELECSDLAFAVGLDPLSDMFLSLAPIVAAKAEMLVKVREGPNPELAAKLARDAVRLAPLRACGWIALCHVFMERKQYGAVLRALNASPLGAATAEGLANAKIAQDFWPGENVKLTKPELLLDYTREEATRVLAEMEIEGDETLRGLAGHKMILEWMMCGGMKPQAYSILATLLNHIDWDDLLTLRGKTFFMEGDRDASAADNTPMIWRWFEITDENRIRTSEVLTRLRGQTPGQSPQSDRVHGQSPPPNRAHDSRRQSPQSDRPCTPGGTPVSPYPGAVEDDGAGVPAMPLPFPSPDAAGVTSRSPSPGGAAGSGQGVDSYSPYGSQSPLPSMRPCAKVPADAPLPKFDKLPSGIATQAAQELTGRKARSLSGLRNPSSAMWKSNMHRYSEVDISETFPGKRVCCPWLDSLFQVLYEDFSAFIAWMEMTSANDPTTTAPLTPGTPSTPGTLTVDLADANTSQQSRPPVQTSPGSGQTRTVSLTGENTGDNSPKPGFTSTPLERGEIFREKVPDSSNPAGRVRSQSPTSTCEENTNDTARSGGSAGSAREAAGPLRSASASVTSYPPSLRAPSVSRAVASVPHQNTAQPVPGGTATEAWGGAADTTCPDDVELAVELSRTRIAAPEPVAKEEKRSGAPSSAASDASDSDSKADPPSGPSHPSQPSLLRRLSSKSFLRRMSGTRSQTKVKTLDVTFSVMAHDASIADWLRLGMLAQRLNRDAVAEQAYRQCVFVDVSNLTAWNALLHLYANSGETKECLTAVHHILQYYDSLAEDWQDEVAPCPRVEAAIDTLIAIYGLQRVRQAQQTLGVPLPTLNQVFHDAVKWHVCGYNR